MGTLDSLPPLADVIAFAVSLVMCAVAAFVSGIGYGRDLERDVQRAAMGAERAEVEAERRRLADERQALAAMRGELGRVLTLSEAVAERAGRLP